VPRQARKELPDGLAHVTCRSVRRFPLFVDARDALALLDLLDYASGEAGRWSVLAYCLMPNHVHYVVDAEIEQLSLVMRYVNGNYAQRFNRVHGFRGHLFQGRFHTKPIRDETHLPGALRYVIRNPVRAGLCEHPQDWRWSSYRECLGLKAARRFLDCDRAVSLFGVDPAYARASLRSFVEHEEPADALARGQSPGQSPSVAGAAA
jgi:REP element-mobilizing transposase RayT